MSSRPVPPRLHTPSTRRAARDAGISDWQLRHAEITRLSRDTYLPRAQVADLRTRLLAILATAPAGTVVSHHTAAALWRVQIPMAGSDGPVHLTVPPGSRARNRRDRRLHRSPLGPEDVERRWGVAVTTPARTWRDLAAVLPPDRLLAVTDQLLQALCVPAELEQALARAPIPRGSVRAREVLAVADPHVDSPMESIVRWLLHAAGLPRPTLQFRALDDQGRQIGFGDLAWPDRKVLVEFDGDVHRERSVFVRDLRRQNRLVLAGWTVLRFTSADVIGRPQEVVDAVRRALGR
ncbi:DUF559 domain-containing protein [Blastococcus sp. CCUG 61487]|uniref:DUF559 domain-containing protein n=1 Tax=Blastococcus sp. CCUG 61487 TaxID=1840703 RepID=UPI0010BFD093|nr:DUF559 domain-containing protein [Blastococcus sp. CCUG 61487]